MTNQGNRYSDCEGNSPRSNAYSYCVHCIFPTGFAFAEKDTYWEALQSAMKQHKDFRELKPFSVSIIQNGRTIFSIFH